MQLIQRKSCFYLDNRWWIHRTTIQDARETHLRSVTWTKKLQYFLISQCLIYIICLWGTHQDVVFFQYQGSRPASACLPSSCSMVSEPSPIRWATWVARSCRPGTDPPLSRCCRWTDRESTDFVSRLRLPHPREQRYCIPRSETESFERVECQIPENHIITMN